MPEETDEENTFAEQAEAPPGEGAYPEEAPQPEEPDDAGEQEEGERPQRPFAPDFNAANGALYALSPQDEKGLKIDIVIRVMKNIVANPDGFEIITNNMIDPELFNEEQLLFLFQRDALRDPALKTVFKTLNTTPLTDLRLLSAPPAAFDALVLLSGAMIYGRYILKTVEREKLLALRGLFPPAAFDFIRRFAKSNIKEPLFVPRGDFKDAFREAGSAAFYVFFNRLSEDFRRIAYDYAGDRLPEQIESFLKLNNDYVINLVQTALNYLAAPEQALN